MFNKLKTLPKSITFTIGFILIMLSGALFSYQSLQGILGKIVILIIAFIFISAAAAKNKEEQ